MTTAVFFALVFSHVALAEVREAAAVCPAGARLVLQGSDGASGCGRGPSGSIRVGHWIWRGSDGKTIYELTYDEQGRENGLATSYGLEGNVIQEQRFLHGQLDGAETRWWPGSGHLREQKNYRAGKIHGIRKRWAYEPRLRKDCTSENKACWVGSEECWVDGERHTHDVCNGVYADTTGKRAPASKR